MKQTLRTLLLLALVLTLCCSSALAQIKPADQYQRGIEQLQQGKYNEAYDTFNSLGHYLDATMYAMYTQGLSYAEQGNFFLAVEAMNSLPNFQDSVLLTRYYTGRAYELLEQYEEAAKTYENISLFLDVAEREAALPGLIKARDYRKADKLEQQGKLEQALYAFKALGSYSDAPARVTALQEKLNQQAYAAADKLEKQGKLDEAMKAFKALIPYSDSEARAEAIAAAIIENNYQAAVAAQEKDDVYTAYNMFVVLKDYKDSAERAAALKPECDYRSALEQARKGNIKSAYSAYVALGDYKDSREKARLMNLANLCYSVKVLDDSHFKFQLDRNGNWGFVDFINNYDIAPQWGDIYAFDKNNNAMVKIDNSYSLINQRGIRITSQTYSSISNVSTDGLYVASNRVSKNYRYSYTYDLLSSNGQALISACSRIAGSYDGSIYAPELTNGVIIV